MNFSKSLLALGLAALPASALAFAPHARALDQDDDAKALVQKLGDKEYKVRRDAYRELEKLGPAARPALESAAKSDDPEVRWNASRLLDRLDEQAGGLKERGDNDEQDDSPRTGPARHGLPRDLEQQMRELERRMQEFEKELDREGFGFFHGSGPFGLQGGDPFRRFGQGFGQFPGEGGELDLTPGSSFSRSSTVNGRTESFSLRIDQNGHVTAEETKDGKTTKVEADSLEAFRKEHPEMLHRGPLAIAIHPFGPGMKGPGEGAKVTVPAQPLQPPQPDASTTAPKKRNKVKAPKPETVEPAPAPKDEAATQPKPRLGVELAPVPSEIAEYLELDGDAFQVTRVLDDMPAARKGLKPRDILLEVNGKPIHAFDDVLKALDGADPNTVKVVVLRKGQRKEL